MKDFNWKYFERYAIWVYCKDEETFLDFIKNAEENNYYFFNKNIKELLKNNKVIIDYTNTVFGILDNKIKMYDKDNIENLRYSKIIKWKVEDNKATAKNFKFELHTGYAVTIRENKFKFGIVLDDFIMFEDCYLSRAFFNNDLTSNLRDDYDIMKIYRRLPMTGFKDFKNNNCSIEDYLLWEREEKVEEMTLEEVCKALGRKIKIKED